MQVNMYEAKTKLTYLIRQLDTVNEIILARNGKPVAKLVPYEEKKERPFGLLKGKHVVPDDIDILNDEISEMFGVQSMRYLLDTHIILWALVDDDKIEPFRGLIADPRNEIYFSPASIWEIAIKHEKGSLDFDLKEVEDACVMQGYMGNLS